MTLLNMAATYQSLLLFLLWWWLHSSGCYCNCGFQLLLMMCLCFKPLETKWIQLLIHGHLNNIPLTPQSIIKTKQNEVLKKRANNLCHLKFTWQGLFLNWYTHTHTLSLHFIRWFSHFGFFTAGRSNSWGQWWGNWWLIT